MTVSSSNNEVRRLIAMDQGIDSELGIVGLGYSPDNGLHFFVTNTIKGRVFRQKDADRLWPFMKGFVSRQIKESLVVTWDNINGKPNVALKSDLENLATKDEVKKIEKEPGPPGQTWQPYVGDDGNWHLKLIVSGGEI